MYDNIIKFKADGSIENPFKYDETKADEIKEKLKTNKMNVGLIKGVKSEVYKVASRDINEVYFLLNEQKQRLFNLKDATQIYYNVRIGEIECQYYGEIEYQISK